MSVLAQIMVESLVGLGVTAWLMTLPAFAYHAAPLRAPEIVATLELHASSDYVGYV